jgi:hypothetical protein
MKGVHTYPVNKMGLGEETVDPVKDIKHPVCTASSPSNCILISKKHNELESYYRLKQTN